MHYEVALTQRSYCEARRITDEYIFVAGQVELLHLGIPDLDATVLRDYTLSCDKNTAFGAQSVFV